MLAAILICGASVFTSCKDNDDNPATAQEEDVAPDMPTLKIDPNEFQPIDVSVALLGSLANNSADVEAAKYWLMDVTTSVTDETQTSISIILPHTYNTAVCGFILQHVQNRLFVPMLGTIFQNTS